MVATVADGTAAATLGQEVALVLATAGQRAEVLPPPGAPHRLMVVNHTGGCVRVFKQHLRTENDVATVCDATPTTMFLPLVGDLWLDPIGPVAGEIDVTIFDPHAP